MMFANATNFYRKSGVAERRDLQFLLYRARFRRSENITARKVGKLFELLTTAAPLEATPACGSLILRRQFDISSPST
jgi:hypothetical protein